MLAAARFGRPERIPVQFGFSAACWRAYEPSVLTDLMEEHRVLFPSFRRGEKAPAPVPPPWQIPGQRWVDSWSCEWETAEYGMTGAVVKHGLGEWSGLETFVAPDPEHQSGWTEIDWPATRRTLENAKARGWLRAGSLRHGHTFLTLTYLRGYENLMFDMADGEERLGRLIEMIERFNVGLVERYVQAGIDWMSYPEDLGMQRGPMISPGDFRRWIKPVYQRMVAPAREAGCVIHMHSDGDVRELVDDLMDCGMDVLNIQDLVNGIDWMADRLKGRVCIDLDLDRQQITRFGTPEEIDRHVRNAVEKLGSREGGLVLRYGCYPGIPVENVRAVMGAMERYGGMYS